MNILDRLKFRAAKMLLSNFSDKYKNEIYWWLESSYSFDQRQQLKRYSTKSVLNNLKLLGWNPEVVIDGGAFHGEWSKEIGEIFPSSHYILFEPQVENNNIISENLLNFSWELHNVILGRIRKEHVKFYLMGTGSSVREELTSLKRNVAYLPMTTLDEVLLNKSVSHEILLKLDVQGNEADVIKGAEQLMNHIEVAVLETAFLNYNKEAPLAHELISLLASYGFVVFDFGEFLRRGNDNALTHADIIFIKRNSRYRQKVNDFKGNVSIYNV